MMQKTHFLSTANADAEVRAAGAKSPVGLCGEAVNVGIVPGNQKFFRVSRLSRRVLLLATCMAALHIGFLSSEARAQAGILGKEFIPTMTFSESLTQIPDRESMAVADKPVGLTIKLSTGLAGFDINEIGPTSVFRLKLGDFDWSATYSEATTKKIAKDNKFGEAVYDLKMGKAAGTIKVSRILKPNGDRLSFTVSLADVVGQGFTPSCVSDFLDLADPGKGLTFYGQPVPVIIGFGSASGNGLALAKVTTSLKRTTFGSEKAGNLEEYLLNTVKATGVLDRQAPVINALVPKTTGQTGLLSFNGTVSDLSQVTPDYGDVQLSFQVDGKDVVPPSLVQGTPDTTSGKATFAVAGLPVPTQGNFTVSVIATDSSDNVSSTRNTVKVSPPK